MKPTVAVIVVGAILCTASTARAATFELVASAGPDATFGFLDAETGAPTGGRITSTGLASVFVTLAGPSVTSGNDDVLGRWGFGGGPVAALDSVAREGELVSFTPNLPVRALGQSLRGLDASGRALFGAISDDGVSALWLQDQISETPLSMQGVACADAIGFFQQGNPSGTVLLSPDGVAVFSECNGLVFATSNGRTEVELPPTWPAGDGGAALAQPTLLALDDLGRAWLDVRVGCAACAEGVGGGLFTVAEDGTIALAFDINAHPTVAPILAPTEITLDAAGHIAGLAAARDPGGSNELVVFRFDGTFATVIARSGDAATDNPDNPISLLGVQPFSENVWLVDDGDVVFFAQLSNPAERVLLRSDGGAFTTLMIAGQDAGVIASGSTLVAPGVVLVSAQGRLAATGDINVPGTGLVQAVWLSGDDGALRPQLYEGQDITLTNGSTVEVLSFSLPHAPSGVGVGTGHGGRGVPIANDGSTLFTISPAPFGSPDLLVKVTPSAPPPSGEVYIALEGPTEPVANLNPFELETWIGQSTPETQYTTVIFSVLSGTLRLDGEVEGCIASEEVTGLVDVTCERTILSDDDAVITLPLFVAGTEAIEISATITAGGLTATDSYANTVADDVADIAIAFEPGADDYNPGKLIVANLGPNTASDVVVTYPGDALINTDCSNGCPVSGSMLSGETVEVVLGRGSSRGGTLNIFATVHAVTPDPDESNNSVIVQAELVSANNPTPVGGCTCGSGGPDALVAPLAALVLLRAGAMRKRRRW